MDKEDTNIVNTKIIERTEGEETVPLIQNIFIEVGGRGICGGSVDGRERLCMSLVDECNRASHTRSRGSGNILQKERKGSM